VKYRLARPLQISVADWEAMDEAQRRAAVENLFRSRKAIYRNRAEAEPDRQKLSAAAARPTISNEKLAHYACRIWLCQSLEGDLEERTAILILKQLLEEAK
jgi:hypothetical protein